MSSRSESHPCPRCDTDLEGGRYGDIPCMRCPGCSGSLISRRNLRVLLEAMVREMPVIREDATVEAVEDAGGGLHCAKCGSIMEHYGYMGSNRVMIDGCDSCGVVWLDVAELGAMCLLFARTELRGKRHDDRLAKEREFDDAVFGANLLMGHVSKFINGRYVTDWEAAEMLWDSD